MPSPLHEAFVTLFHAHVDLALRLARQVGVELSSPREAWKAAGGEFADPSGQGKRYATDVVLAALSPESESLALEVLILEPQLSFEPEKAVSWLVYRGGVAARYGHCPQWVLTISPAPRVLVRYREEVYTHNRELQPIFVGPGSVSPVLDLAEAQADPIWAAFCAAMHCRGPLGLAAAEIAIRAGAELPADARRCTLQLLAAGMKKGQMQEILNRASKTTKVELTEYEREGAWYLHGLEDGLRSALFITMSIRDLVPDLELRARIEACDDAEQLQCWVERASRASTLAEVFAT
ncbi:hypothetical protein ACNOYE_08160 [Nannocystaceae bacterium ST9]